MYLTDFPRPVKTEEYERSIERMAQKLANAPGLMSLYQIGGVSHPGISDVDLIAIFEDDVEHRSNPLENLAETEKYLFIHNLFGTSKTHFDASRRYPFFHDYRLLAGSPRNTDPLSLGAAEDKSIGYQVALEYLIKMYVNMTVERAYGVLRVRGMLLHAKALLYDLDMLGGEANKLRTLVEQALEWRRDWFRKSVTEDSLLAWHDDFYRELAAYLRSSLARHTFYIPGWADTRIAPNMSLEPGQNLGYRHRGLPIPSVVASLSKKMFNLFHRFNSFVFTFPFRSLDIPEVILQRHGFFAEIVTYNRRYLPFFVPVPYGLPIFRKRD